MKPIRKYGDFISDQIEPEKYSKLKYHLDDIVLFQKKRCKIVRIVPGIPRPYQLAFIGLNNYVHFGDLKIWVREDDICLESSETEEDNKIFWWKNGKLDESLEDQITINLQELYKKYNNLSDIFEFLKKEILSTHILYKANVLHVDREFDDIQLFQLRRGNALVFSSPRAHFIYRTVLYEQDVKKIPIILYFKKKSPRVYSELDPYGEEDWSS